MKYLLALIAITFYACVTSGEGRKPDPIDQPEILGYSLGLGCQGQCLDTDGDSIPDASATEVYIGDMATATVQDSMIYFVSADNRTLYIPDSLRIAYWTNASFQAAISLQPRPSQRTSVTLPDHRLEIVRDSCVTWNQSAFPEPVPCIPILALRP